MNTSETKSTQASEKPAATADQSLRPAMDIFEDATGITVLADMPGVPKEKLDIQIDKDSLTVGGEILLDMPSGMDPVYADVRKTRYQRSFTLSRELDTEKTEASFKDGVLILRIPKREAHQTRKIQVKAA
ncbi:MAG: Hsp20/alpha crystallin family protein [Gammaproteobacteria bacterium]|nr:Hsp20/alpha crystallin family protein [Gammaproteobacteria bacterium]